MITNNITEGENVKREVYKINKHDPRWTTEQFPQMDEAIMLEKKIYIVVGMMGCKDEIRYKLSDIQEYAEKIKKETVLKYGEDYYTVARLEEIEKAMNGGTQE